MTNWHLAQGYLFAGVPCGIRQGGAGGRAPPIPLPPDRRDLALVVSAAPAAAAGVFTQNRVVAAPVHLCRERLPGRDVRGIVICSGNANACTGQQGLDDARRMAALAAEAIGCREEQVLVASTGVIGRHLPMPRVEHGIRTAARELQATSEGFDHAAHAILTTDTRIKVSTRKVNLGGLDVAVTGFCKGAAMMGPNMATMLAFVLSDATVGPDELTPIVRRAAEQTFNCVSVEGHTSTNDTLLLLANGNGRPLHGEDLARYAAAVTGVCADLAKAIAADAEGAHHLVTLEVEGLRDDAEARRIARAVADSALVKTAIYGADPNWGRIISAAGYAGVAFEEKDVALWLGDLLLYQAGVPQPFDAATASAYLKKHRDVHVRLRFALGSGHCTFYTCDLTPEYVRLNSDYTT